MLATGVVCVYWGRMGGGEDLTGLNHPWLPALLYPKLTLRSSTVQWREQSPVLWLPNSFRHYPQTDLDLCSEILDYPCQQQLVGLGGVTKALARQKNDSLAHHEHIYQANFRKNWLLKLASARQILLCQVWYEIDVRKQTHCHTHGGGSCGSLSTHPDKDFPPLGGSFQLES